MQNFFNKVGKTASEAAAKAGSKASELMEIGKLKGKISAKKQNSAIRKKTSAIIAMSCLRPRDIKDPRIEELCEQIKAYGEEIESLEAEIETVQGGISHQTQRRRSCCRRIGCRTLYGGALVSTGVWKPEERAAVCPVCVKRDTLNINAKKNNNFAPMARLRRQHRVHVGSGSPVDRKSVNDIQENLM